MTEDIAVTKFREYLCINTEQPNPDYEKAYNFLKEYGSELELQTSRVEVLPGKPVVILKLSGTRPELKSLLLYSHMDVVPTFRNEWKHDPYAAVKEADGKIYARGAQDMKSVGIQYLEAYRRLKAAGKDRFTRSIFFVFGADEEIGGDVIAKFVRMSEFASLNAGFILDEGLASETDVYKVFYGERCPWWVEFTIKGNPGHASLFVENDVASKLQRLINTVYAFRDAEKTRLQQSDGSVTLGDVASVNLTKIEGGVQLNVVPSECKAYFDIRVPPFRLDEMESQLQQWCFIAGPEVSFTFEHKTFVRQTTPITKDDPFWNAFATAMQAEQAQFVTEIFPASTDSSYFRALGYRSIGFSPMNNTPVLLHDHNEFLEENVFLRGVEIYVKLIDKLANVDPEANV